MSATRSSSLPQCRFAMVGRRVDVLSMESVMLPNLNFAFFSPLSRKKDPSTTAFDTAAAAKISELAHTVRYCWRPW